MVVKLKTPGLRVDWVKGGSFLYARVIHTQSGLPARNFTHAPIVGGKKRFVIAFDKAVAGFDWTREASVIAKDKAAHDALWSLHPENWSRYG